MRERGKNIAIIKLLPSSKILPKKKKREERQIWTLHGPYDVKISVQCRVVRNIKYLHTAVRSYDLDLSLSLSSFNFDLLVLLHI